MKIGSQIYTKLLHHCLLANATREGQRMLSNGKVSGLTNATTAMFLQSFVAQALNLGDESVPRYIYLGVIPQV